MKIPDFLKDKAQMLNSYINESKFSSPTVKLKEGIHEILEELPFVENAKVECNRSLDNNGRQNLSNVKTYMENLVGYLNA